MAFESTVTKMTADKSMRVHMGTWTTDTTGGDIDTGLSTCYMICLTPITSASADAAAVNETLPVAGSAVTIVCTSGVDGYWIAWGE